MTHGNRIKIEVAAQIWRKTYSSIQKGMMIWVETIGTSAWGIVWWMETKYDRTIWFERGTEMRLCTLIQYFVFVMWLLHIFHLELSTYPAHIFIQLPCGNLFMEGWGYTFLRFECMLQFLGDWRDLLLTYENAIDVSMRLWVSSYKTFNPPPPLPAEKKWGPASSSLSRS